MNVAGGGSWRSLFRWRWLPPTSASFRVKSRTRGCELRINSTLEASRAGGAENESDPAGTHQRPESLRLPHRQPGTQLKPFLLVLHGRGFSFTGHEDAYASDAAAVARDLHEALTQFLQVFAEFRHNDMYVAGIAEGGKHAAALAVHIHDENSQAAFKINLKGIAIGNGAQDPSRLTDHGELFYHLSFFDEEERDYFKEQTDLVVSLVVQKKWLEALEVRQRLLGGGLYPSFFVNVSRFHNLINTVEDYPPLDLDRWEEFVALPEVRRELHLGGHTLQDPAVVRRHLREETMRSVEPWIVKLLENNYRVLLYNGQLDLTFPYFATENMVSAMKWSRADEYFEAPRRPWRVRGRVMGYEKSAGGLMRVMVRNAGLLAGRDQPLWTFAMINTFMREKVFT